MDKPINYYKIKDRIWRAVRGCFWGDGLTKELAKQRLEKKERKDNDSSIRTP
jgi:hypothetical protein